jgi:glutamate racemase
MKIGVFDSGIGGKSIAEKLEVDFPDATILYVDDHKHVPYGSRAEDEIIQLTRHAIQPLLDARCDAIVIACNTAAAAAIEELRRVYPDIPFVGLEPMVKTAVSATRAGTVAICATPYTLSSQRYLTLKAKYARDVRVLEPDCSRWAFMIEHDSVQEESVRDIVDTVCAEGADVIVLACTHYHWIKQDIIKFAAGRAAVIDPSEAISRQIGRILSD